MFAGQPGVEATCIAGTGESDDPQSQADAAHIALNDPQLVLAEIEATRQILDFFDQQRADNGWYFEHAIVWRLAQSYASWPGYREEWRP